MSQPVLNKRLWLLPSLLLSGLFLWLGLRFIPSSSYAQPLVAVPTQATQFWLAVGDTGSGTEHQKGIAKAMEAMLALQVTAPDKASPATYPVLMLGDLIYPEGNYEKLGKTLFTEMYAPLQKQGGALKPAVGNHDVVYKAGASYRKFFGLKQTYYAFQQKAVAYIALDTNHFDAKQQLWLETQLKAYAAKPWIVVFAHHPILSSGQHSNDHHLQKTLLPLLQKYHVALYLTGHDHDYERFNVKQAPLLVVSGGGGAYLRPLLAKREPTSAVGESLYHYLAFEGNEQFIRMVAYNEANEPFDCVTLKHESTFVVPNTSSRLSLPQKECAALTFEP